MRLFQDDYALGPGYWDDRWLCTPLCACYIIIPEKLSAKEELWVELTCYYKLSLVEPYCRFE